MRRRWINALIATLVAVGMIAALVVRRTHDERALAPTSSSHPSEGADADAGRGSAADRSGDPDAGNSVTSDRLQALRDARQAGTLGVAPLVPRQAVAGWSGERVVSHRYDDWEPAIAADPKAPHVYRLVTRYGGPPACAHRCPDPAIVLQVSHSDGRTWGPSRYLCRCAGTGGEFDPQIEVAATTGEVEAAFMRDYSVWFTRSLDHGRSWSKAVAVAGSVAWQDKPILVTSADGKDVYVAFNGPKGGDPYVSSSHDGGATWQTRKVVDSPRYIYAFGGAALADGTVVFSESSLQYSNSRSLKGATREVAIRSTDGGATWRRTRVATLQLGKVCTSQGCPQDFYDGHTALGADGSGRLLMVADGAVVRRGFRRIFAWLSTDGGATWGPRVQLSRSTSNAGFPAVVGTTQGQFRVWFMDRRTGRWNVWYRTSSNGSTWSTPVKLSNAIGGAVYKTRAGFEEGYGDYGEIDVTNRGKTVAIWGEGPSYRGPGGCWFTRQL
jgi:BNR repeat-like domain